MMDARTNGAYVPEELQTLLNVVANNRPFEDLNIRYVVNATRRAGVNSYGSGIILDDSGVMHTGTQAADHRRR